MNNLLTPTKQNPTFVADNDYYGFIESGFYHNSFAGNSTAPTFALSYEEGISKLHQYIKDCEDIYSTSTFNLYLMDGTLDKNGDSKYKKVYSISTKKAKQLLSRY